MNGQPLDTLLKQVQEGLVSIQEAKAKLLNYDDIGFAKLDYQREARTGFPEVVYGEGKTKEEMTAIFHRLTLAMPRVLATRVDAEKAAYVLNHLPEVDFNERAGTLFWKREDDPSYRYNGYISVVCAGTSDLPVAEEAAVTVEAFGCKVERIYDVGVAGLHRLLHHLDFIRQSSVVITVAGMEGALSSVLAGLIDRPMIAVPTSIGYGAHFNGLAPLLSMLNGCAPGINVVNIDNGFGGGYNAALIHRAIHEKIGE